MYVLQQVNPQGDYHHHHHNHNNNYHNFSVFTLEILFDVEKDFELFQHTNTHPKYVLTNK